MMVPLRTMTVRSRTMTVWSRTAGLPATCEVAPFRAVQDCITALGKALNILHFPLGVSTEAELKQLLNTFLTIIRKFLVVIRTLLYVFGSCECHSKLAEEMHIPLRPIPTEDSLCP